MRSPVDGIVTARYVDPGTLIPDSTTPQSNTLSTSNSPIVALATMAPLRVYAYVPQSLSPYINDGDPASITVSEFPGRQFAGTVTRHPDALDQSTRTTLVEVDLPNTDRALYPGVYAEMRVTARVATNSISAPDDALVFRNNKVYLPLVRNNHLNLLEVTLGHDNGYTVEVDGDLRCDERRTGSARRRAGSAGAGGPEQIVIVRSGRVTMVVGHSARQGSTTTIKPSRLAEMAEAMGFVVPAQSLTIEDARGNRSQL